MIVSYMAVVKVDIGKLLTAIMAANGKIIPCHVNLHIKNTFRQIQPFSFKESYIAAPFLPDYVR